MASWMDYLNNPRGNLLKKAMFEILKERYAKNEQIVERMSVALATEGDMNDFMKLITDVYEIAYLKAVNDHKEQLQKIGLTARIVPSEKRS